MEAAENLSNQEQDKEMLKLYGMWERFADFHDMLSKELDSYLLEEPTPNLN